MSGRIGRYIDSVVRFLRLHPIVDNLVVERRIVTQNRGYLKATVTFVDRSQLHIREFVDGRLRKVDYVYHYQGVDGKLVFRYDNTPHHGGVTTFPHHKHVPDGLEPNPSGEKTVIDVVNEIAKIISEQCDFA